MDLKDLTKFDEAFNEFLKWATVKSRESQDAKMGGKHETNMDLGGFHGDLSQSGQGGAEEWKAEGEGEKFWFNHPSTGELLAFQVKGSQYGKGEGSTGEGKGRDGAWEAQWSGQKGQ